MVAAATDTAIASPDSGARNPDVRLQEHASRAALYVTHPARGAADAHNRNHNPRDVDQKLSSAGCKALHPVLFSTRRHADAIRI